MMGRMAVPLAAVSAVMFGAMLAALLAVATPAYPQVVSEDLAADEDGNLVGPRPPDYEVDGNGLLVIGGDVRMPCSEIGGPPDLPGASEHPPAVHAKLEWARIEQIRACRAAGFDTAGKLSASTSPGSYSAAEQMLPETGGPALPAPLLPSAAVLLSAVGLLALRARR